MDAQTKIIRASHMIDMNDIIREGDRKSTRLNSSH